MKDQDKRDKDRNDYDWRQFIKLGDMIGDGLHNEPDGKWITKEYNRLAKILIPEDELTKKIKRERRIRKNLIIDQQIKERIDRDKCKCGGNLKQTRSGSTKVQCIICNSKFIYKRRKTV